MSEKDPSSSSGQGKRKYVKNKRKHVGMPKKRKRSPEALNASGCPMESVGEGERDVPSHSQMRHLNIDPEASGSAQKPQQYVERQKVSVSVEPNEMPDFIEEDEIFRVDPHEVATSTEQRSEMPSTSVGENFESHIEIIGDIAIQHFILPDQSTGSIHVRNCISGEECGIDLNTLNIEDLVFLYNNNQEEVVSKEISHIEDRFIGDDVLEVMETDDEEQQLCDSNHLQDCPDEDKDFDAAYDFLLKGCIEEEGELYVVLDRDEAMAQEHLHSFHPHKVDFDHIDQLMRNLVQSISNEWVISRSKNILRLALLGPFENVCVSRAISISENNVVNVFVHNKKISPNHFMQDAIKGVNLAHIDETTHYLVKLCCLVENSIICRGIRLYPDEWAKAVERKEAEVEKGYYHYNNSECLRDVCCSLLVAGANICEECARRARILKDRHRRQNQDVEKDRRKTNIKHITGEEAKEKCKDDQKCKKQLIRRICKLKNIIKNFVERETLNIDPEFGTQIGKIFQQCYDKMTNVQKLFWGEQVKALSKQDNPRQMRWNPFVIKMALHLQMISSSAFRFVKGFLPLPSERTLFDFTHFTEAKEDIQEAILEEVKKKMDKDKEKKGVEFKREDDYFNLIFDEMDVCEDIVISRSTGCVIGYTNLTENEKEMANLEAEILKGKEFKPQPAKKVLVFMALGVTNEIQEIAAVFTTSGSLTTSQLHTRVWEVVYRMENYEMKVLALICDGASVNKKFFRMHTPWDPHCSTIYATKNVASGEERPIFFLVDPVHILKSLRNNYANSYSHRHSRKMWKNGESISWQVIETLFSLVQEFKYQETKLTKAHVKLTSHSCMTVVYAAQTLSNSVHGAIDHFKDEPRMAVFDTNELLKFIKLVNDWFDCLNGHNDPKGKRVKGNELLRPYTPGDTERFDFMESKVLRFFDEWYEDVQSRPGNFSADARERMFISYQTYESVKIATYGFINAVKFMFSVGATSIVARQFLQDKLEQFFGLLRMSFGGNTNPNVANVVQKTLSLHVQGQLPRASSRGNTQVLPANVIPDESPIPRRASRKN